MSRSDVPLIALCALLALTLAVFALRPDFDLAAAGEFFRDGGFVGASWRAGREFFRVTPFVVAGLYIAAHAARRWGAWRGWAPTGRALAFVILTFAVGPGLIVNAGLKAHSHRPRPIHVTEFGGTDAFKPWYQFDGGCGGTNCAFASGEASEGFWMVAPALAAPPPLRAPALAAAFVFGAGASALRMAAGAHFLSDVLVGGLISLIVIALAWRWLRVGEGG